MLLQSAKRVNCGASLQPKNGGNSVDIGGLHSCRSGTILRNFPVPFGQVSNYPKNKNVQKIRISEEVTQGKAEESCTATVGR